MHKHHITEMVESLTKAGLVPPERKEEAGGVLGTYWSDKMALTWTVEDVLDVCPGLTEEEARHVLGHVRDEHDASIGVNWDVIQCHGTQLYGDRAAQDPDEEGDGEDGSDSERHSRPNTRVRYFYRDRDGDKIEHEVVVAGSLAFADIQPHLYDGNFFIAGDVGLPDIQLTLADRGVEFPTGADDVFCDVDPAGIVPTDEPPTVAVTAADILAGFRRIAGNWDVDAARRRMGIPTTG